MDVIGVAVVSGADGDDRLEFFRLARGDLQAVETTPGDADHADRSGAPRLRRDPLQYFEPVVLFLFQVLVMHDTVGITGTPDVDAYRGITVSGVVRVVECVAGAGTVAQAVRQVLQNGGHRVLFRVDRQPDAGSQPATVRQADPGVLDDPELSGHVAGFVQQKILPAADGCSADKGRGRTAAANVSYGRCRPTHVRGIESYPYCSGMSIALCYFSERQGLPEESSTGLRHITCVVLCTL